MKKTSMYGLVGLAAAVAGAVGGNRALGNYLYDHLNHPPVRSPEREERYPVQQEGRLWARSMEGFQEAGLTAASTAGPSASTATPTPMRPWALRACGTTGPDGTC